MSQTPNTKLGTYKILAPLCAGGMGGVYRARDSRLDRDVAAHTAWMVPVATGHS